jgi:hypothetical protein
MKKHLIRSTLFVTFATSLACLLSLSTSWAQSPFIAEQTDLDSTIQEVTQIQDRYTDWLLQIPGVVGTGITILPDGQYAIKILTRYQGVEKDLPESLEGVPVVVEEVGDIRALAFTGKFDPPDPVPTGVSVGNKNECAAGTNGAVVEKNGVSYFLSNNHVFARENNAAIGEDIVQPGRPDSVPQCDTNFPNHVADLSEFKKINYGFLSSNTIDAAIAQIQSGTLFTCKTACDYTPSDTTITASVGMNVKKCGRTTMETTGEVTGVNVTVFVGYSDGKSALFTRQTQFSDIAEPGDSGSLIVTNDDTNRPVALLFAGSATTTIGNPINDVLNNFNVSICNTP